LDVIGHEKHSLLNGGLHAWANEGHALEQQARLPVASDYKVPLDKNVLADKNYILKHLESAHVVFLDSRTSEEFSGIKKLSARGGHIPHAVNLDWLLTMDKQKNLRLLPDQELNAMLTELGIQAEKEVIAYCQSHHRSSHAYIMLKHLGFKNIKGYPGAWSDWGNDPNTPIET
jgi:thiosulfate/3-mercaptopyruvate sulfurtransferase